MAQVNGELRLDLNRKIQDERRRHTGDWLRRRTAAAGGGLAGLNQYNPCVSRDKLSGSDTRPRDRRNLLASGNKPRQQRLYIFTHKSRKSPEEL